MSLLDIKIEPEYRNLHGNIIQDFYNPLLSESIAYNRSVGFFSSTALTCFSVGLCRFLKNGGVIKLVATPYLSDEDIQAMKLGYATREKIVEDALMREFHEPLNEKEADRLNLLASLIAECRMDIKIALTEYGMYHEKLGVIEDAEGNYVSFSGSSNESANAFLNNYECALIIINKFAAKNDSHDREIFLPSNLTLDDKEEILKNYLQSNNPNVNYVRLVTQIKNVNGQIRISPKTKLLAERLAKKLGDEMLSDPKTVTVNWSIRVQFADEDGVEPVWVETDDNGTPTYSYSIPYIRKCDNVNRVANCVLLFQWLNRHALLNLINKNTEVDKFESLLIDKGRDSYPSYMAFENKSKLSLYQLFGYDDILKKSGSYFERELKLFYEHYLKEQFDYPSLPLTIPNSDDSALIKCRVLCPELDAIVKQYNIFIVEDEIDKDLIRLSQPLKVEEGKSFLVNKYYEIAEGNEEIQSVLWGLFGSGNSMLSHVEPFTDKDYSSLVELLEKESNVQYSNYANFQKPHLNFLIQQGLIGINSDGGLYVVSQPKLKVLKSLWEYEACSYWHYNDEERNALDDMFAKGWLVKDEHLLSKPERDYFSFFLDNAKFTNGKAYRNHYMHGSTPPVDDENEHSLAYLTFLRLLAILLLKIEDDLWLARRVFAIYVTNEIKTHRGRS